LVSGEDSVGSELNEIGEMAQVTETNGLSVVGGGTIALPTHKYITLSWPLVVLTLEGDTLAMRFRARWAKHFAELFASGHQIGKASNGNLEWWSSRCSDISKVRVSQRLSRSFTVRSIIVESANGDVSFGSPRYASDVSHRRLGHIVDELERSGVKREMVDSNFRDRGTMSPIRDT
jgi:hypothetical protein